MKVEKLQRRVRKLEPSGSEEKNGDDNIQDRVVAQLSPGE